MSRRIEDLAPDFQDTARAVMRELEGLPVMLYMTRRTLAEQRAYYAQGRQPLTVVNALRDQAGMPPIGPRDNGYTVTNCDGERIPSAHQSGRAIDIVALGTRGEPSWDYAAHAATYMAIRDAAARCSADAGGSWMTQRDGSPSPYAAVGLGWDPPHVQAKA